MLSELQTYQNVYKQVLLELETQTKEKFFFYIPLQSSFCSTYNFQKCLIFVIKKLRDQHKKVKKVEFQKPNVLCITKILKPHPDVDLELHQLLQSIQYHR